MSRRPSARSATGFFSLVILCIALSLPAAGEKTRGDTSLFYEGQSLFEARRWDQAADRFSGVLEQYPKSILRDLAYFWLIRSDLMLNKTSEAEAVLGRFRKEYPDSPLLAKADKEIGEARERIAAITPAKKIAPASSPTGIAIHPAEPEKKAPPAVVANERPQQREKAIALYRKVIHDAPHSKEAKKARERLARMRVPVEPSTSPPAGAKPVKRGQAVARRGEAVSRPRGERLQGSAPGAKNAFSVTITQVADVQVELRKDKFSAYPGEFAVFPFSITNRGNASDAFQLASDVPADFQPAFFADSSSDGKIGPGEAAITGTPLIGVGETFAAALRIRLPIAMPDGQKLEFGIRVSSRFDPSIGRVAAGNVVVAGPLVTGTFKADRERVKPGGTLTYVIRVANSGSAKTGEIRASYLFHPNLIFLSSQPRPEGVEQATRALSWTLKEIPSGTAQEIEVKFKVGDETPAGQEIINRGTLSSSTGGEPTLLSSPVVTVDQVAGVRVEGPREEIRTTPGDRLFLPFTVKNLGNGTDGFTLKIEGVDAGTAALYSDSNGDGLLQAGEPKITGIQNLAAHGVAHLLVEVAAPMVKTDGQKLDVALQADSAFDRSSKDRAARALIFALPIVSLSTQAESKESIPGGIISYRLMALNSGSGVARQVSIVDDLPAELEYVNSDPQPAERNGRRVVWKVGELGPNQKRVVTVSVRAKPGLRAGTVIENETHMTYEDLNGNGYE